MEKKSNQKEILKFVFGKIEIYQDIEISSILWFLIIIFLKKRFFNNVRKMKLFQNKNNTVSIFLLKIHWIDCIAKRLYSI